MAGPRRLPTSGSAERCASDRVVAVGDFNASVDDVGSARLGGCTDAASAQGSGSIGTWPTGLPTWLGLPIDHVLLGSAWRVRTFTVVTNQDGSGARHRPIVAVLVRRPPAPGQIGG